MYFKFLSCDGPPFFANFGESIIVSDTYFVKIILLSTNDFGPLKRRFGW